jgi:methylmalonyl-CoA/ethylmalonyl-CoA epimerase
VEVRSVHHVAFAVTDLDEALETYQRLFGARVELRGRMDDQGVEAAYVRIGDGRVELVSAVGEDSPVGRFLAKRGPGMHHVAYQVADVGAALRSLRAEGVEVIDPEPRPGLGGHEVSFVHPDSVHGVLVEVISG